MVGDELADLIDEGDGVEIAFALRLSPGEQAMPAEHDAIASGVLLDGAPHHEAELKTGTLPGNPNQRVVEFAIELFHLDFAIGGGRKCDAPVGMKMIDVREGKEAVERRVDRGGNGIVAEGAQGIHGDHVIFRVDALVTALEGEQLLLVESGEAGALHAAEVAARTFDPENFDRLAREGIDLLDFGTGVAPGEVGDAQI